MSEHDHEHDHDHAHDDEELEAAVAEEEAEVRRRFALAQIRQYGDVALRMRAHDITEFDDDLRRLFVFEPDEDGPRALVNPVIVDRSDETEPDEEGCLSLQGVRVPVDRATRIVVEGKDENGQDVRYELEGYAARVAQHEFDHLDGVLIIDRTDDEHRKGALAVLRPRAVLR